MSKTVKHHDKKHHKEKKGPTVHIVSRSHVKLAPKAPEPISVDVPPRVIPQQEPTFVVPQSLPEPMPIPAGIPVPENMYNPERGSWLGDYGWWFLFFGIVATTFLIVLMKGCSH